MALAIAAFITGIALTLAYLKFTGAFDSPRNPSRKSGGGSSKGSDPEVR